MYDFVLRCAKIDQRFRYLFNHRRWPANVEVLIEVADSRRQPICVDLLCFVICMLLVGQGANDPVTKHAKQFALQENVFSTLIAEEQSVFAQLALLVKMTKDRNEWRDPGTAGNEDAGALVLDRAPWFAKDDPVADLDVTSQTFRHSIVLWELVRWVTLDDEFQSRVGGKTGHRERSFFFSPTLFINRKFDCLTGTEIKIVWFFNDVKMDVFRHRLAMQDSATMLGKLIPVCRACFRLALSF